MRVAVLTTETSHHAFYVATLAKRPGIDLLSLIETDLVKPKFETRHPYEDERDAYEWMQWFAGKRPRIAEFSATDVYHNINQPEALQSLLRFSPDLVFVFGTRKLDPAIIRAFPDRLFNFHSGDPQRYRGLDSHLWAIHDGAFDTIRICLHKVEAELDTGDIVFMEPVPLRRDMELFQLRKHNTDLCPVFTNAAIDQWQHDGAVRARPQTGRGVYKSFMPGAMKSACIERFRDYVRSFNDGLRLVSQD